MEHFTAAEEMARNAKTIIAHIAVISALALTACGRTDIGSKIASKDPPAKTVCDIAGDGRAFAGHYLKIHATLVVDSTGGRLTDARCPHQDIEFVDDPSFVSNRDNSAFEGSFDRALFTQGVAIETVDFFGNVTCNAIPGAQKCALAVSPVRMIKFTEPKLDPPASQ